MPDWGTVIRGTDVKTPALLEACATIWIKHGGRLETVSTDKEVVVAVVSSGK